MCFISTIPLTVLSILRLEQGIILYIDEKYFYLQKILFMVFDKIIVKESLSKVNSKT